MLFLRTGIPGLMQPGLRGLRGFRWSGMRMSWTGRLTGFVRMPAESGESCSVADLEERVISGEDYERLWNNWCDVLHEVLELQRADGLD